MSIDVNIERGDRETGTDNGWVTSELDGSVSYHVSIHPAEPWEHEAAAIMAKAVNEVAGLMRRNRASAP